MRWFTEIDWEEVAIPLCPSIAILAWLIAIPVFWCDYQEQCAFDRESATLEISVHIQKKYRDRIFNETPPPPQPGPRVRVDVNGVIVSGYQVNDRTWEVMRNKRR